jgi:dihydrofolate reductase
MRENLGRVITAQDAVLLGRGTCDEWAGFWPTSDNEPFASFINSVEKFVVTATPPEQRWEKTTVVEESLADFVTQLKPQPGGDIGIHGSTSLTQSLLQASLVDELRLVIAPVVHIHGRMPFDRASTTRLSLTRSIASPTGYLLLDYQSKALIRRRARPSMMVALLT